MNGNTFGHLLQLTTFGESHGAAVGGILTGMPAGINIDLTAIQYDLDRRKPGQSRVTTARAEDDVVHVLSGLFDDKTTGTPIGFMIHNKDHKPKDYDALKDIFRPSHADYTYQKKYGIRDYRGSGRASARETASRVVAGSFAKQLLSHYNIRVNAFVSQVGGIALKVPYQELDFSRTEESMVRCPDKITSDKMIELIDQIKSEGDSIGGIITGVIQQVPAGLGEPVFHKLNADLGYAMLGINAVKGFDFGLGFEDIHKTGSELNDEFYEQDGKIKTKTNFSGGIQGGISNGMDIYFRVAFKPASTIKKSQQTITKQKEEINFSPEGRHDPCVLPRAVPIVEAMAALVLADHVLLNRSSQL